MISNRTIGIITIAVASFIVPFAYAAFKPVTPVDTTPYELAMVTIIGDVSEKVTSIEMIHVGDTVFHAPIKTPAKKKACWLRGRKLETSDIAKSSVVEWGCK